MRYLIVIMMMFFYSCKTHEIIPFKKSDPCSRILQELKTSITQVSVFPCYEASNRLLSKINANTSCFSGKSFRDITSILGVPTKLKYQSVPNKDGDLIDLIVCEYSFEDECTNNYIYNGGINQLILREIIVKFSTSKQGKILNLYSILYQVPKIQN